METKSFQKFKKQVAAKFKNNTTEVINKGDSTKFNGALITNKGSCIAMSQPVNIEKIYLIDPTNFTKAALFFARAKGV